jgi:plastocyanin
MTSRRVLATSAALVALGALAGATEAARAPKQVSVGDNFFDPATVVQRPGGKVRWTWTGTRRHDVFFYAAPDDAKPRKCSLRRGGACVRTFRKKGTYRYVCTRHGSMAGAVKVRP